MPAVAACRKILRFTLACFTLACFHDLQVKVIRIAEDDHALALRQGHWRAAGGDRGQSRILERRRQSVDIPDENAQHSLARLWKRRSGSMAILHLLESDSVKFQSKQPTVELRRLVDVADAERD